MSGHDEMETLTHSNTHEPTSRSALVPFHLSALLSMVEARIPLPPLHIDLFVTSTEEICLSVCLLPK